MISKALEHGMDHAAAPPRLSVRGLTVRYGPITALDDLSLDIEPGQVISIVGPNGAGKSSLLAAIAGTVKPVAGSIFFNGQPTIGQPLEQTVRRGIALVPEGRHVLASLTVLENLRLGATIRTDAAQVAREIDQFFEAFPILGERRREAAGRLSGGEQQMLVIARALLSRPALLMLDEPSLGLAPKITDQIYAMLASIRRDGVTILIVEQNAARALAAADRTYVLNGGTIRIAGTEAELSGNPDFEAAYFGLAPPGDAP